MRVVPRQEHRSRSATPRAASSSPRDVQDLLLEFGVICRRAEYANGEIKLVIGNRRDAELSLRGSGSGAPSRRSSSRSSTRSPAGLSTNDVDRIPFLAEYVRAESGARGADKKWLEKHSFDRTADWERRGHEILGHIPSAEVRQVIAPLVSSGWYFATVESVTDAGVQPVYLDPGRLRRPRLPRRRVRQPQHRIAAGAAGDAAAGGDRRGHRRLHAHLRRQHQSSRWCSRRDSPTSWSTEEAGSPSVWRRTSRRTTSGR